MVLDLKVLDGRDVFIESVAFAAEKVIAEAVDARGIAHVVLTGGTIGVSVLTGIGRTNSTPIDWSRVHFWWGDERFVSASSDERNCKQAREALLARLNVPEANIHEMPSSDSGFTLDESAGLYSAELAAFAGDDAVLAFDLTFLGIGPDAHVASLFPDHPDALKDGPVLSVRNSPKPPPERITLSFESVNASQLVWIVAFGQDKALAVRDTLAVSDDRSVPSSCVHGIQGTTIWADVAAASLISS